MSDTSERVLRRELRELQFQIDDANSQLASKQRELGEIDRRQSEWDELKKLQQKSRDMSSRVGYRYEEENLACGVDREAAHLYDPEGLLDQFDRATKLNRAGQGSEQASFVQGLLKEKMSSHSIDLLLKNGCDSVEVLRLLTDSDLDVIGLSIGQKRLLQAVLKDKGQRGSSELAGSAVDSSQQATQSGTGQFPCNFFLGMGVRGNQKPYLDICDFVSIRSPYEGVSESQTVITNKSDGSFEVKPLSFGKRVTLDKVTMSQWIEANMLIMHQLVSQGIGADCYMAYTIMISQIAQKYKWLSVLLFDREYRKMQANLNFTWGEDKSHLRDVLLVPKSQDGSFKPGYKSESGSGEKHDQKHEGSAFKKKARNSSKGQSSRSKEDDMKMKLCYFFNDGKCTRRACPFKHFCAECGSGDHGEKDCSKLKSSPNV